MTNHIIVEPSRPQVTIRHMRIARWTLKATNTHSEYVILIDFPCNFTGKMSVFFFYGLL